MRQTIAMVALTAWIAPLSAQVPVNQEPRHRVVHEDAALRVLNVRIPAGDTTLDHLHQHDMASVCISESDTRTQNPREPWGPVRVRSVGTPGVAEYADTPNVHRVENIGTGVYGLIAVENLRLSGWSVVPAIAAIGTTVAQETRAFRTYEVRLTEETPGTAHVHTTATVAVLVSGTVGATLGQGTMSLVTPGEFVVIPAKQSHGLTRVGVSDVQIVEFEVR